MTDAQQWEEQLIAEMRANGGEVTQGPLAGHPLLVMTSRGAKSGEARRAILTYSRDGDDYIVAGTAGGAPTAPAWVYNLQANPEATVERGTETFEVTAEVIKDGHNGLLVEAGDVNGFARAILDLLDDSVKRDRLGQNARQDALEKYSWEQYTRQLDEIYLSVIP